MNIEKKNILINEEIREKEVRVIGSDGNQYGIMSSAEANKLAEQQNTDLILISGNANPPVCKLMDYGKYKFELVKKEKEQKKNQKVIEIKEVRLSMTIDTHDIETKARNVKKFLTSGNKVKISLRMKGRQQAYWTRGIEIVKDFYALVSDLCDMEKEPMVEGRNINVMFIPKKK